MSDTVIIADRHRNPIGEVDATVVRAWSMRRLSQGTMATMTFSTLDEKYTDED